MKHSSQILIYAFSIFALANSLSFAVDWPMWRFDAQRTASTPQELPQELFLLWTRQYSQREMVWDDPLNQDLMRYDRIFEPIVLGKTLYIGFNDRDKIVAFDTGTGAEKWTFYADGPVRLPLAGWKDKVYFTSDDGYLYCVTADKGNLLWKFRGGPTDRKILGNKRLISTWPARGGAVIDSGTVYFAASIWPFMGTFIYAIDAQNGDVVWRNDGTGSQYMLQPHNSPAFASIAPQGALVVSEDRLLIPGGRSVPACFDRKTGEMLYYHLAESGKTGGAFVCADDRYFFNHHRARETHLYDIKDGKTVKRNVGKYPVIGTRAYYMSGDSIRIRDIDHPENVLASLPIDASADLIKAGDRLYAAGNDWITCIQIGEEFDSFVVKWSKHLRGVERLIAADDKLFAVSLDGKITAFGASQTVPGRFAETHSNWTPSGEAAARADRILQQTGVREGYALYYCPDDGETIAALAMKSELNIIAVVPDKDRIKGLRRRFDDRGLLGSRVTFLPGTPATFEAPPYMAELIVVENAGKCGIRVDRELVETLYPSLRPYGGKLWLGLNRSDRKRLAKKIGGEARWTVKSDKNALIVSRDGPLPGSSNWTHQYGDIRNTVKSDDELVKLPLGVLWFGGSSHTDVLPRHGHGPPEQIVDGRLIIEGMSGLSARDVYTGRVLWYTELENPETYPTYFNETYEPTPISTTYNQEHLPGANSRGTNFVVTSDRVYIIDNDDCRVLDIANGETVKTILLPLREDGEKSDWGYIGVLDDYLLAGADFVPFSQAIPQTKEEMEVVTQLSGRNLRKQRDFNNYDNTASRRLLVLDRRSGEVKWQIESRYGFIHNSIIAGDGIIYCLDKYPPAIEKKLERRGLDKPDDYRLIALDADTGEILWLVENNVFGTWLGYSRDLDLLIQATRPSRDMIAGEDGERMIVYEAKTGRMIWDRAMEYNNPPIIHGEKIITDRTAYDIHSGEQIDRSDPLTGEKIPWTYTRGYGCNYHIASEHLLSFRSAAAGFYDLFSEGGTGNLGGFKSGCTANLIAANGVLNAPDYTYTCQCSYQNQTSLAFVYMPELEYWTTNDWQWSGKRIVNVGINLNAPGDRMAEDGTLWLDFPSVGGDSPDIPIMIDSLDIEGVRRHSSAIDGEGEEWIAASGLLGRIEMTIDVARDPITEENYTVSLYFAELMDKKDGERIFDVYLQDSKVLPAFDIVAEAGGTNRSLVKSFQGIKIRDKLIIRCLPCVHSQENKAVLCGVKIKKE